MQLQHRLSVFSGASQTYPAIQFYINPWAGMDHSFRTHSLTPPPKFQASLPLIFSTVLIALGSLLPIGLNGIKTTDPPVQPVKVTLLIEMETHPIANGTIANDITRFLTQHGNPKQVEENGYTYWNDTAIPGIKYYLNSSSDFADNIDLMGTVVYVNPATFPNEWFGYTPMGTKPVSLTFDIKTHEDTANTYRYISAIRIDQADAEIPRIYLEPSPPTLKLFKQGLGLILAVQDIMENYEAASNKNF